MNILDKIGNAGLVPVVVLEDAEDAVPAARALLDAGLGVMEITMRTDAGIQAIKNVRRALPDMLVGAGTILTIEKCKEAVEAGAQFIVSPGFNPTIVEWCIQSKVAVTPGCVTPTEIDRALSYGLKVLKFFPASVYGGVKGCKALYGPYKSAGIKFIPTGGINNDNLVDYADKPFIHALGGGWLCKTADVASKNFGVITENAKKAIDLLLGFEMAHVGVSQKSAEDALEVVNTNSIKRAIYYLGLRGFEADMETAKYKGDRMIAVYLKDEFGGFAVHLLQK